MSRGTLVDSNVILDILTEDPTWSDWSADALAAAAEVGSVHINPVIYSEVSIRFTSVEALDLLTRDVGRCRTYFPTVALVAPTT